MASYSELFAKHPTLTGTTVDDVTITGYRVRRVIVSNRAPANSADLSVSHGWNGEEPDDPTAGGDDTYFVPPGGCITIDAPTARSKTPMVKVIGNGNTYSVEGFVVR